MHHNSSPCTHGPREAPILHPQLPQTSPHSHSCCNTPAPKATTHPMPTPLQHPPRVITPTPHCQPRRRTSTAKHIHPSHLIHPITHPALTNTPPLSCSPTHPSCAPSHHTAPAVPRYAHLCVTRHPAPTTNLAPHNLCTSHVCSAMAESFCSHAGTTGSVCIRMLCPVSFSRGASMLATSSLPIPT